MTNPSFRVGFDMDGVVYDFRRSLCEYAVLAGRPELTAERMEPHWNFFEGWDMSLDEYLDFYRAGVDAGHVLRRGTPFAGSVEATERLHAAGHSVHFVTDRSVGSAPGIAARHSAAWLAENEFVFDSLTISADKSAVPCDFFIDDRYENYVRRSSLGQHCVLLTQPWNVELGDESTERVDSVAEFVDLILLQSETAA